LATGAVALIILEGTALAGAASAFFEGVLSAAKLTAAPKVKVITASDIFFMVNSFFNFKVKITTL
jgi:hypothetical protein